MASRKRALSGVTQETKVATAAVVAPTSPIHQCGSQSSYDGDDTVDADTAPSLASKVVTSSYTTDRNMVKKRRTSAKKKVNGDDIDPDVFAIKVSQNQQMDHIEFNTDKLRGQKELYRASSRQGGQLTHERSIFCSFLRQAINKNLVEGETLKQQHPAAVAKVIGLLQHTFPCAAINEKRGKKELANSLRDIRARLKKRDKATNQRSARVAVDKIRRTTNNNRMMLRNRLDESGDDDGSDNDDDNIDHDDYDYDDYDDYDDDYDHDNIRQHGHDDDDEDGDRQLRTHIFDGSDSEDEHHALGRSRHHYHHRMRARARSYSAVSRDDMQHHRMAPRTRTRSVPRACDIDAYYAADQSDGYVDGVIVEPRSIRALHAQASSDAASITVSAPLQQQQPAVHIGHGVDCVEPVFVPGTPEHSSAAASLVGVVDVILDATATMSDGHGHTCTITDVNAATTAVPPAAARASSSGAPPPPPPPPQEVPLSLLSSPLAPAAGHVMVAAAAAAPSLVMDSSTPIATDRLLVRASSSMVAAAMSTLAPVSVSASSSSASAASTGTAVFSAPSANDRDDASLSTPAGVLASIASLAMVTSSTSSTGAAAGKTTSSSSSSRVTKRNATGAIMDAINMRRSSRHREAADNTPAPAASSTARHMRAPTSSIISGSPLVMAGGGPALVEKQRQSNINKWMKPDVKVKMIPASYVRSMTGSTRPELTSSRVMVTGRKATPRSKKALIKATR